MILVQIDAPIVQILLQCGMGQNVLFALLELNILKKDINV
jgi:hypothetical protein